MSWLSDLTGKAEDFLNRIDQSAAEALTKDEVARANKPIANSYYANSESGHSGNTWEAPKVPSLWSSHSVPSNLNDMNNSNTDLNSSMVSTPLKQSKKFSNAVSSSPTRNSKKKDSDDALFEFLNETKKISSGSSNKHSRQSSMSSTISNLVPSLEPNDELSTSNGFHNENDVPDLESVTDSPMTRSFVNVDANANSLDMVDTSPEKAVINMESLSNNPQDQVNASQLEIRLLHSEIETLNNEMASMVNRAKSSENELEAALKKINEYTVFAAKNDQIMRELQSREMDIQEALNCKDSQLAVLKIRLEEADSDLRRSQSMLEKLEKENNRVLMDHSASSGVQNQALETLKTRLSELEDTLKREREAYQKVQAEASERQSRLEYEQQGLAEQLNVCHKKMNDEKGKSADLTQQLKTVKMNLEGARQELSDYKEKASRILQSKERLIASLRNGSDESDDSRGVSTEEFNSVRSERDMYRDELQQIKLSSENAKVELQDIESQLHLDRESHREEIDLLQDQLVDERRIKEETEQDLLKQKKELHYTLEELHKQKALFHSKLKERDEEVDNLKNQLMTKSLHSNTEDELESRVRTLTESLIQKQTVLEAISTEKNSLSLQLERLEQQYKDVQMSIGRTTSTGISVNENEDVRQRLPLFLREAATDHEMTRRMKRAANTIDKFSVRLGVFLRRYPIARVFVIVYMALLHLWVMVVLLTYKPEIHNSNFPN
ncbi:golgin subfamily A member 5 [Octopus sinensis]|uniref:Golgin subfamily A member 5 n=1 Tax=Octopus sinensis TaxID=2607531 RepID=A0A6P7SX81_9MOLL|nr:golgin subfamily A member 5 [Octopus sinensis]XP_029642823.1 golgin subfamily A member 5 [Octopus sinensis]